MTQESSLSPRPLVVDLPPRRRADDAKDPTLVEHGLEHVGKNGSIFRIVLWSATPPNAETRQLMANCLGALAEAHDESVPDL